MEWRAGVGQGWNGGLVWDGEPGAEVVPERHSELLASFHQAQERIPAIPAHVAAGSAAHLAPGHLGADVVLRSVGVERDLGGSSTRSSSGLLACNRASSRSRTAKPVRRPNSLS